MIPSWVLKVLPPLAPGARIKHDIETPTGPTSFERDAVELTVKRVCRSCNHGWMENDIEVPNQAILPPLFRGGATSLTPDEQQHVATWAIKTHLMAQYRHTPFRPAPKEQLHWLYKKKTPHPKSQVWLGAFAGGLLHRAWGRTYHFQLASGVPEVAASHVLDAEMMTLCICHLVLQTFKWTGAVEQFGVGLPDEMAKFVLPIWPPSSLVLPWPPAFVLDTEESLQNLAQAFVHTGPPPEPPA